MEDAKKSIEQILKIADIKIGGSRPFDIQVHDNRFYKRILSGGELGAGEAYMDGWWSANQLDEFIARLTASNARNKIPITKNIVKTALLSTVSNRQKITRSYKNAAAHYDIGNDLYSLMLDERMVYTCAYWEGAKSLEEAQIAKLDRVCKKLKLKKGMTLLDIGCGWGGFSEYAAKYYGVKVTGISPAIEQVKLAKARTKGLNVTIKQQDYRELSGKFDRIASIGVLEHVGPKNYDKFFKKCNEMLKPGGIMLHHTIGRLKPGRGSDPWIDKYIFPGGVLPSLSQLTKATEPFLIIEDIENFGPDYDKTLMVWHKNFVKNYPKLKDDYDERFYRMWEFYLLGCAGSFRARSLQLWQLVMTKAETNPAYRGYR
jgi:cyclopropane-fatty-acyl-phospholipid synthase